MTPAVQAPVTYHDCPKPKDDVSNQGLKAHVKRKHQSALDQVQKLATILLPLAPGPPAPGPLPPDAPASGSPAAVADGSGLVTPNMIPSPTTSIASSLGQTPNPRQLFTEDVEKDQEHQVLEDAKVQQDLYKKTHQHLPGSH